MALSGLSAQYVDGQLVTNTSQTQNKETTKTAGSGDLDKDAFLQLLVAQMKYQDPLEPTSKITLTTKPITSTTTSKITSTTKQTTSTTTSKVTDKKTKNLKSLNK